MNHWIFCATAHKDKGISDPHEIIEQRFRDKFWGLGEKTPNRRTLQAGDEIIFYLGVPHCAFAASAKLASDSFEVSPSEQQQLSHGLDFYRARYGVRLSETRVWERTCRVEDVVGALTFVVNKQSWGAYFQGGVRYLPEEDFKTISEYALAAPRSTATSAGDGSFAFRAEFALETHLEEFIDKNWKQIDFGKSLQRYVTDEENGRQFPAGPWSIDFLCKDATNGNLVVIELKRGQTSDQTIGQTLRYIAWIEENIAEKSQEVEGIIIAREVDDALRYALRKVPSISVLTYRVDFALQKAN
jgi:hypothetical protein